MTVQGDNAQLALPRVDLVSASQTATGSQHIYPHVSGYSFSLDECCCVCVACAQAWAENTFRDVHTSAQAMNAFIEIDKDLCVRGDAFLGHPVLRTLISPSYLHDVKAGAAQTTSAMAIMSVLVILAYVAGHDLSEVRIADVS